MSYHVQKAVSREENIQTELLVIFLLEGRMTLKYQDESYQMKAEDIILCLLIKQLSVTSNSYICSGHARIGTDAKEHKVFASES